jgi:hypothetical protein
MTLLQIAREHCANWRKDGRGCLGAIIDDDLQIRRCIPKSECVVGVRGRRCQYFEECVAPMAPSLADGNYRQSFEEVVRQYRVDCGLPYADERPCPVCGRAMEPRRRFCHICAAARRREATRLAVKRHRVGCKQLTGNGPLETKGSDGVSAPGGMETADGEAASPVGVPGERTADGATITN